MNQTVATICREAMDLPGELSAVVATLVDRHAPLASDVEHEALARQALAHLRGLGPLEELLDDPSVDEVFVNRGTEVWVDRAGTLSRHGDLEDGTIEQVLERILTPLGRRIDRRMPVVDAELADGSRLCAAMPPIAADGTCVAIRRHRRGRFGLDDFATPPITKLLRSVLAAGSNVLVTGATSSGKTTFLDALAAALPPRERLVVVEDTTELSLVGRHAVRLEARPSGADGLEAIDLGQLVRIALRLRPDRLVVGEFRGTEAMAAVEAFNTGHDGSLSTCHANSALDGLRRLETLVMQAAPSWPLPAIRRQVTRSIDVVVHLRRGVRGRRVVEVLEVTEGDGEPCGRTLAIADEVVGDLLRGRR